MKILSTLASVAQWIECRPANQRALAQFPVRAHAWVPGWVPSCVCTRDNHTLMFLSLLFLPPFPFLLK